MVICKTKHCKKHGLFMSSEGHCRLCKLPNKRVRCPTHGIYYEEAEGCEHCASPSLTEEALRSGDFMLECPTRFNVVEELSGPSFECCENCRRWSDEYNDLEVIEYERLQSYHWRREMCLEKHRTDDGRRTIMLCSTCYVLYSTNDDCEANLWSNVWPTWIWMLLREQIQAEEGRAEAVWIMLPIIWRSWWLRSLNIFEDGGIGGGAELVEGGERLIAQSVDPQVPTFSISKIGENEERGCGYSRCSLESPCPLVEDVGREYHQVLERRKENLAKTVLCHMREDLKGPEVLCPWGCTEFIHKCGTVKYSEFLRHYLPNSFWRWKFLKHVGRRNENESRQKVMAADYLVGARRDFLEDGDLLSVFVKQERKSYLPLRRCVRIDNKKGAILMVCGSHDEGTLLQYIHPPLNPAIGTFASECNDQFAHVVLAPRKVKSTRAHTYNTTYQVSLAQGKYDGIDSCFVQEFGTFDKTSTIMTESVALSLAHREDMKDLLETMNNRGIISNGVKDAWLGRSKEWYGTQNDDVDNVWHAPVSRERALKGATFMSFIDALKMESMALGSKASHNETGDGETAQTFIAPWPQSIVHVHECSQWGEEPQIIDDLSVKKMDTFIVWSMVVIACNINEVWEVIVKSVKTKEEWYGWFLCFCVEKILRSFKQKQKNNPYCPTPTIQKLSRMMDVHCEEGSADGGTLAALFGTNSSDDIYLFNYQGDFSVPQLVDGEPSVIIMYRSFDRLKFDMRQMRRNNEREASFPMKVTTNRRDYKLQYISARDFPHCENLHEWKGVSYFRHRESMFDDTGWWKYYRHPQNEGRLPVKKDHVSRVVKNEWTLAVFTSARSEAVGEIHQRYLKALGGQTRISCERHKYFLVSAPFRNKLQCSFTENCTKYAEFQCPWSECKSHICKNHAKQCLERNEGITFVSPCQNLEIHDVGREQNARQRRRDKDEASFDVSFDSISSTLSDSTTSRTSLLRPHDSEILIDEDSVSSLESSIDFLNVDASSEHGRMVRGPITTQRHLQSGLDEDIFVHDVTQVIADDSHLMEDDPILTTDAAVPSERGKVGFEGPHRIQSHVLLNSDGHCLKRHGVRLMGNRTERAFLQRLVSTTSSTVPLLYPEAMMFPSIFWMSNPDGSMIGALPACCWSSKRDTNVYGIAGFEHHICTRIKNTALLCSSDSRYISVGFDVFANIFLRGRDSRMIMKRGFGMLTDSSGLKVYESALHRENNVYSCDTIDSRRSVNCLSAQMREIQTTYFITRTVNTTLHPGLAEFRAKMRELKGDINRAYGYGSDDGGEYQRAVDEHCCMPLVRIWHECSEVMLNYILRSPEEIVGKVEAHFHRYENQEETGQAKGDLKHGHLIVSCKREHDDNITLNERIRCSSRRLFSKEDVQKLLDLEIIDSVEEVDNLKKLAMKIIPHSCATSHNRCFQRRSDGKLYCRYVHFGYENPDRENYTEKVINLSHDSKALEILETLGFISLHAETNEIETYHDLRFKPTTHLYPAELDEHFCPMNIFLFAMTKSVINMKRTGVFLNARYLSNYVASIDYGPRVYLKANEVDGTLQVDVHPSYNTKIASSRIAAEREGMKKKTRNRPYGRMIGLPEMIGILLKHPTVSCSSLFVGICSTSKESRAGITQTPERHMVNTYCSQRRGAATYMNTLSGLARNEYILPAIRGRQRLGLPLWRQFTQSQCMHIADESFSDVSIDGTTRFSIRPPELFFIDNQTDYLVAFTWIRLKNIVDARAIDNFALHFIEQHNREATEEEICQGLPTKTENLVKSDVFHSLWIDGFESQLKIRKPAIKSILCSYAPELNNSHRSKLLILLSAIYFKCFCKHWTSPRDSHFPMGEARLREIEVISRQIDILQYLDTSYTSDESPFPIYNSVKPSNPVKFIVHLCLSLGRFATEIDLWDGSNMIDIFHNAQLLLPGEEQEPTVDSVNSILKAYIDKQLLFVPAGTKRFDKCVIEAKQVLTDALLHRRITVNDMPGYLFTALQQSANDKLNKSITDATSEVLVNLLHTLQDYEDVPHLNDWLNVSRSSPLQGFTVHPKQTEGQSDESFFEQYMTFKDLHDAIHVYMEAKDHVIHRIIAGKPGCGKTHLAKLAVLHALSQGLLFLPTSLLQERSRELGSWHIHNLFCLSQSNSMDPHKIVDNALSKIIRSPLKRYKLQRLDGLFIDEGGVVPAQILYAMDMILRYVRKSNLYMGGLLLFITMDHEQNGPVNGTPLLLHANIVTNYKIIELQHYVRNRHDPASQELNDLVRQPTFTEQTKARFLEIFTSNCTFVESWDDQRIQTQTVRILGTRNGTKMAEEQYLSGLVQRQDITIMTSTSEDTQCTKSSLDNWRPATCDTINFLNRNVKEIKHLKLYKGALYAMTSNNGKFWSQGQVAILIDMPEARDFHDPHTNTPICVYLAPSGVRSLPLNTNSDTLVQNGWKPIHLQRQNIPFANVNVNSTIVAQRKQYPLVPRIASTNHKAMGSDFLSVATTVNLTRGTPGYIWLRSQVIVLLSRTHYLKNLIFVTERQSPEDVGRILLSVLQRQCQYYNHMSMIMNRQAIHYKSTMPHRELHNEVANFPIITQSTFPFRPMDIVLPSYEADSMGYTYILMSRKDYSSIYIGSTKDLSRRVTEHNRGLSRTTGDVIALRPWSLIGYVTSFIKQNKHQSLEVEIQRKWHEQQQLLPNDIGQFVKEIIQLHNNPENANMYFGDLKYIECAKF